MLIISKDASNNELKKAYKKFSKKKLSS